jgi:protein-tyrosine phosphatase
MRAWLKGSLPPLLVDAVRDLRVLPRDARASWWRAARHHLRQRDNELLPSGLVPPLEIVTLCYGNIYRSPVAAAALAREAARRGWNGVTISSAGFVQREGRPSPEDARAVARELGLSLAAHTSSRLTRERADAASLLLVMDRQHEALLLREHPHVLDKIVPLWRLGAAPGSREEVLHDPYGRGIDAVRTCYQRIQRSTEALADALDARLAAR